MSDNKPDNQVQTDGDLISHHIFLLPFKWLRSADESSSVLPATAEFANFADQIDQHPDWHASKFTLDRVVDYNEWHYFYDYVREVLYETKGEPTPKFIRHFEYLPARGGKYRITTPIPKAQRSPDAPFDDGAENDEARKEYVLEIDSVLLHLYYSGIGVLSIHLNNYHPKQRNPEDILYINQYGRRLYPPFFPIPESLVGKQSAFDYTVASKAQQVEGKYYPHGKEIPYSIETEFTRIPQGEQQLIFTEKWENILDDVGCQPPDFRFSPGAFYRPLLQPFIDRNYALYGVLDDRMFVVSWFGHDEWSKQMLPDFSPQNWEEGKPSEQALSWWYKYVFVDREDLTVQNPVLRQQYLEQASYLRWAGYGSYYGVTDYSLVLLTGTLKHLRKVNVNASFLVTHLQTIYFRLVELTLVQRACVQRFSDDITHISRLEEGKEATIAAHASALYRRYIRFVNRIYFREVTAQVQGIELYERLHKQSRLRESVESLDDELRELNAFVQQVYEQQRITQEQEKLTLAKQEADRKADEQAAAEKLSKRREEQLNQLSLIGAVIAGPSLLYALFGLIGLPGDYGANCTCWTYGAAVGASVFIILLSWIAFRAYQWATSQRASRWAKWGWISCLIIAGLVILLTPLLVSSCQITGCQSESTEKQIEAKPPLTEPATEPIDTTATSVPVDTLHNH